MYSIRLVCLSLLGALAFYATSGFATPLPSEDDLVQDRSLVEELTVDDFARLRAKDISHREMVGILLAYARAADTPAARFLLIRTAFRQQVLACLDASSALPDVEKFFASIREEDGPIFAYEIARFALSELRKLVDRKVEGARTFMKTLVDIERKVKNLRHLETQIAQMPDDAALRTQFGFACLALDDWTEALRAFARNDDPQGEIARFELDYPQTGVTRLTSGDVADFWWTQAEDLQTSEALRLPYRLHAAAWYRTALTNGVFRGLKKALVEKKIMEADRLAESAASPVPSAASTRPPEELSPIRVPLLRDIEFLLVGCPPGTFTMGNPRRAQFAAEKVHSVTITRPFWIAKYKTTREQFKLYQKFTLSDVDKAIGGFKAPIRTTYKDALGFCDYLTKKYRSKLPTGYVFRLPTEAEWEYALYGADLPVDDPYVKWREHADEIMVGTPDWEKAAEAHRQNISTFPLAQQPLLPVGLKRPNFRGIYDLLGNGREYTLDTVNWARAMGETALWTLKTQDQRALLYEDFETDPLRCFDGTFQGVVMRGVASNSTGHPFAKYVSRTALEMNGCFRIVAGPDLMRERGHMKGRK